MLNLNTVIGGATLAFLGWLGINMVDVKTELAVTHEKISNVEEKVMANHEMIKPIWQEFLMEKNVANLTLADISTGK